MTIISIIALTISAYIAGYATSNLVTWCKTKEFDRSY